MPIPVFRKPASKKDVADVEAASAPLSHSHAESDITGLVDDLAEIVTITEVKADADIADALSKKHANTLDHSNSLDHTQNTDTDLETTFEATFEKVANKGAANGYAPLGADSKVPSANLPSSTGGFEFPIGAVYLEVTGVNPATTFGYGTWAQIAQGQFLAGQKASDTDFDTVLETGGAKTHTHAGHSNHSVTQPSDHTGVINHTHPITDSGHAHVTQYYPTTTGGSSGFTRDASMSGTPADNTLSTKSNVTGISVNNPAGGVSALTHSGTAVDAHSAHDTPSHLPPYCTVYIWQRTS
jgi:hypothetical protein